MCDCQCKSKSIVLKGSINISPAEISNAMRRERIIRELGKA